MKWFFFFFLLLIAIVVEATITTIPIVFSVLFAFGVIMRQSSMLVWSFVAGLLLDALTFHLLGMSSLFFLLFFGLVFLYERKFEVQSISFVLIFSYLGSLLYMILLGIGYSIILSIASTVIATICFLVVKQFYKKKPENLLR